MGRFALHTIMAGVGGAPEVFANKCYAFDYAQPIITPNWATSWLKLFNPATADGGTTLWVGDEGVDVSQGYAIAPEATFEIPVGIRADRVHVVTAESDNGIYYAIAAKAPEVREQG